MKVASVRLATARAQRVLPVPGGAIEKGAFGRVDAEVHEAFRGEERHLDDFAQFFDLVFAAAHVAVGYVGLVFHGHHGYRGVDLGREGEEDLVFVSVDAVCIDSLAAVLTSCGEL